MLVERVMYVYMCGTVKEESNVRKRRCVTELMEEPRVHMYIYRMCM